MLSELLRDKKGFIFDLDGCIYLGDRPIQGAIETIGMLRKEGKRILFLTNNSTKTPQEYADKLKGMGIEVGDREILTSSVATAIYLKRLGGGECFVLGERGLIQALEEEGFKVLGMGEARRARYVVCGLDMHLTYEKLAAACHAIQSGARFIATNMDPRLPLEGGYIPGAGSIVEAVATATGLRPRVIGKPSKRIMKIALKAMGLKNSEVAMVGDTLEIDMAAARLAGITGVLVLSGSTKMEDLEKSRIRPDAVIPSVAGLQELFLKK
ncbi:MAG: HAD-IIA family hydrolase [Candidatus Methanosuratincola sp.]|jgi:HAD superfamily hydrolase (TIGR01457 family)|nr:HAD-IIA family hydrolase [Candidatus Methanosuratincola sp.]